MLIVANWKMNFNIKDAESLIFEFINLDTPKNEVVVAPAFTLLARMAQRLEQSSIKLAAQNCHQAEKGAYTGEVSIKMIKEIGCEYVILGHSERRTHFGETSDNVCQKATASIEHEVTPIICVGETLEQFEAGKTEEVIKKQIEESVPKNLKPEQIVIAYEPVWAIGTGKVASIENIESAHKLVKSLFKFDVKVIYGGSVNDDNCAEIAKIENVNGMLVGGASLTSNKFAGIMNV